MAEFSLAALLGAAGKAGFGVCRFDSSLLLPGVRSVSRLPSGAKSIILCRFPYYVGIPARRNLALYAMLPDYHAVAGALLDGAVSTLQAHFPSHRFARFVDASPINEVEAGHRAGLGRLGQNGLLLCEEYGSLFFLGEIVTDLALEPSVPGGSCEGCGRCVAACPAGALLPGGTVDASRCRSALSQQKRPLTDAQRDSLRKGGLVWGCDCCLLACPYSRAPAYTPFSEFSQDIEPLLTAENLDALLTNRAFSWRGRPVLERNLEILSKPAPSDGDK